jgi:pSer/pThr/pTyr-binding forkhead associated (FHA) protein
MSGSIVLALRLALALALYAFLGWALFTLWRDLQKQSTALTTRRTPGISLRISEGSAAPILRHFIQAEVAIGRDTTCDIFISDDTISARHARLTYHHTQWWLEDLGSTNGTRLNGQVVTTPTVLTNDDEIACGATTLVVDIAAQISDASNIISSETRSNL